MGDESLKRDYPILEYDPTREAVIEPSKIVKPMEVPEGFVLCFFQDVIDDLNEAGALTHLYDMRSEMGRHPVYSFEMNGQQIGVMQSGVGAPLAAGMLEELIAKGFRRFMACGGAGVLDKGIAVGHVIIPTAAVRDEGTSYHYLPPGREVAQDAASIAAVEKTLTAHNIPYVTGKTWTTDAFYRETVLKVQRRREEGCITVEMEAAAFFAVAQFRGVAFGQILYGGDDVSGTAWDTRGWRSRASTREKLFWLAAEAVLDL